MTKVTYVEPGGERRELVVQPGHSLMEAAVRSGVRGIVAECGGACSCSTCHVYVSPESFELFPPGDENEDALLDFVAADRRPTSRLSCQFKANAAIEQVTVEIPDTQT